MDKLNDKSFLEGLRNGDKASYKVLFEALYGKLLSFVNFIIKDLFAAEDIVQNQFLKLWLDRYKIDDSKSIESLLFVMTKNATLDYLRAQKRKHTVENQEPMQETTDQQDIDHQLDYVSLQKRMLELIDTMPPQRKRVFTMKRIEGLSNQEIARQLGLSVKTVDRHLSMANDYIGKHMS